MERLPGWKADHGEVFYVPETDQDGYALRTFTLEEFERFQIQCKVDEGAAEQELLQKCLLWPENLDLADPSVSQGTFQSLLQFLNTVSPYDNPKRFMDKLKGYRARANSLIDAIYIHIAAAFPSMKLKDIQQLSCDDVLHHLALAEKILQRELEIEGQGVKSESTQVDPKEARARRHAERVAQRRHDLATQRAEASGMAAPEMVTPPIHVDESGDPQRLSLLADANEMGKALGGQPGA
jgi:hypothetical protein